MLLLFNACLLGFSLFGYITVCSREKMQKIAAMFFFVFAAATCFTYTLVDWNSIEHSLQSFSDSLNSIFP